MLFYRWSLLVSFSSYTYELWSITFCKLSFKKSLQSHCPGWEVRLIVRAAVFQLISTNYCVIWASHSKLVSLKFLIINVTIIFSLNVPLLESSLADFMHAFKSPSSSPSVSTKSTTLLGGKLKLFSSPHCISSPMLKAFRLFYIDKCLILLFTLFFQDHKLIYHV